ncbi:MAG: GerAB/ArcD/ProY family transporter [Clostridia bacterium]|nr:GerAB/ArcD/ProY family transporter [Clostridia bacterium]
MIKDYKLPAVNTRQLCFLIAFLFPIARFLEAPRLLASAAKGDLLIPALLSLLLQGASIAAFLFLSYKTDKTLFQLIENALGKWVAKAVYFLLTAYYLFAAVLPLLDLEKFSYAAFFDTAPTTFSFAPFFLLSAFLCTKNFKAVGRSADLCLFLFLLPFAGILLMSIGSGDFSSLLPVFSEPFKSSLKAVAVTKPHFADGALLLPLLGSYKYEKGAAKKAGVAFAVSVLFTLLFLAFFYSVYTTLSPREHYAFAKIAQYFPALAVVGRIDLILVYLLSIVYLFYACLPLQLAVDCFCKAVNLEKKGLYSAVLHIGLFVFVLFFNSRYDAVYALYSQYLYPLFFLFADLLPLLFPLLLIKKKTKAGTK